MQGSTGGSTLLPWASAKKILQQVQAGNARPPPHTLASTVEFLHRCAISAYVAKASQAQLADFAMVYHDVCRLGNCAPNPLDVFVEKAQRTSDCDCDVGSLARVVGAFCEDSRSGGRYARIRESLFKDFVFLAHFVLQQSFTSNEATSLPLCEKFEELLVCQSFKRRCAQLGHRVLIACAKRLSCQRRSDSPRFLFSDGIEFSLRLLSKVATPTQLISVFTDHLANAVDATVRQQAIIFIDKTLKMRQRQNASGQNAGLDRISTQNFLQRLMQMAVHDTTQKVRLAAYIALTNLSGQSADSECCLQIETTQKVLLSALLLRDKAKQLRKKALDVLNEFAHQFLTMLSVENQADVLYWIFANVVWCSDRDRSMASSSQQREFELGVRIVLQQLTGRRLNKHGKFANDDQDYVQRACFASCVRLAGTNPVLGPLLQRFLTEKKLQDILTEAFALAC